MTNNDLIPRKEAEKMIERHIEKWRNGIVVNPMQSLLQEISQIESVNVWIPVVPSDIWSNELIHSLLLYLLLYDPVVMRSECSVLSQMQKTGTSECWDRGWLSRSCG